MQELKIYNYIVCSFSLTACQSEADKRLSLAFELAGDNRSELEKVLGIMKKNLENYR